MKESNLYFKTTNSYNDMSDEDLINVIKSGDKLALEFLIDKYKELVNMKVSKFFMVGAEREDIVQEGLPETAFQFALEQNKRHRTKQIRNPLYNEQVFEISLQVHQRASWGGLLAGTSSTGNSAAHTSEATTAQMIMAKPAPTPLNNGTNLKAKLSAIAISTATSVGRWDFIAGTTIATNIPYKATPSAFTTISGKICPQTAPVSVPPLQPR